MRGRRWRDTFSNSNQPIWGESTEDAAGWEGAAGSVDAAEEAALAILVSDVAGGPFNSTRLLASSSATISSITLHMTNTSM